MDMAASGHAECEFCVQIRSADVVGGDTVELRVSTTNLATWSVTPSITVSDPTTYQQPVTAAGLGTVSMTQSRGFVARTMDSVAAMFSDITQKFLDFDVNVLGAIRYPFVMAGRLMGLPFVEGPVGPQTYFQAVAATDIMTPETGKLMSLFRTFSSVTEGAASMFKGISSAISAETIGEAALDMTRGLVSRTVSAATEAVATLSKTASYTRALLSEAILTPALDKLMSLYRTLAGSAILTAALTKTSSVSQTFLQAVDATAELVAGMGRWFNRGVSAETILTATLAMTRGLVSRTLAGIAQITAAIAAQTAYIRTISAEAILTPSLNKLMSLFRVLPGLTEARAVLTRVSTAAQTFEQAVDAVAIMTAQMFKGISKAVSAEAILTAALGTIRGLVYKAMDAATEAVASLIRISTAARSLAAEAILEPSLNKLMSLFRALSGQAILRAADFNRLISRTLRGVAEIVANLTKATTISAATQQVLAAATIAAAVINRQLSLFRTLATEAILTPFLDKVATISGTTQQALAATMEAVASMTERLTMLRRLAAEALLMPAMTKVSSLSQSIAAAAVLAAGFVKTVLMSLRAGTVGTAVMARLQAYARALAGEAILTPVLSKLMSLYRSLDVAATVIPYLQAASSTAVLLFQAMGAAISFTASLATNFSTDAIIGAHMAMRRVTQFLKGKAGLRRKSSSAEPHTTSSRRVGPHVGSNKRGSGEDDVE